MAQTTIQKNKAIRAGSVKVELGTSLGSLVDIGALRDIGGLEGTGSVTELLFDNVAKIQKYKDGNRAKLVGKLCEINFSNIELMNGGQVVTTLVAGTPVTGNVEVIASGDFAIDTPYELSGQNASGATPTINSVTGSVDGAMVLGTDYNLVKMANGNWAIVPLTGVTLNQTITVNSDFTPAASKVTTFNATGIKSGVYMRITNTNEDGKTLVATLKGVVNIAPFSIDFAGDNEDNVAEMPIELEGEIISIVDSQQTV